MTDIFEFWKNNRIDPSFPLTAEELRIKFKEWLYFQMQKDAGKAMLKYYSDEIVIRMFLSDPDEHGMGVIYAEEQFQLMLDCLKGTLADQVKDIRMKHRSNVWINGHEVEILHIGPRSQSIDCWTEIIRGLGEDLAKGHGFFPFAEFDAAVEWKVIS